MKQQRILHFRLVTFAAVTPIGKLANKHALLLFEIQWCFTHTHLTSAVTYGHSAVTHTR